MSDRLDRARETRELWQQRQDTRFEKYASYTEIENAIFGRFPTRYDRMFNEHDIKLEVRTTKSADMNLTRLTAKTFPISIAARGESEAKRKADERAEKIGYGWNEGSSIRSGVEMDGTMFQLAQHQVRFGDGCLLGLPDHDRKIIFWHVKDPRCHFPPNGWSPWGVTPLDNTLIVYETTLGDLRKRYEDYPDVVMRLNNQYQSKSGSAASAGDRTICKVGEFYSTDAWYCATLDDNPVVMSESQTGDEGHPGVCPVTSFEQSGYDPLFQGQLGLEVALQKVLTQEFQATDEMLHGPVSGSKLIGDELKWDEYNVLDTAIPGERIIPPQRLAPTSPLNSERVIASLLGLNRLMNLTPESAQGGGDANSGKAIQVLNSPINSIVQDILWMPFRNGFPHAYENNRRMEINLWPNERKKAYGKKGKATFEVDYIPNVHLSDYQNRIKIESGFGLGGYQQVLEGMQMVDAELMPVEDFIEMHPGYRDVQGTLRRLGAEKLDKTIFAVLEAQGPTLQIEGLLEAKKRILEKGLSVTEALAQVKSEGLLTPAPEAAAGGMPPELAALMGGGMEGLTGPPPSLGQMRQAV